MRSSPDHPEMHDEEVCVDGPIERLLRLGRCLSDERAIRAVALLRVVDRADEREIRHALLLTGYQMRPVLAKLRAASVVLPIGKEPQFCLNPGGAHLLD